MKIILKSFFNNLFKSNQKNISDLSWLVSTQFATAGLSFLTQVKIANFLGKDSFGQIAYGLLIGSYGIVLVQFGTDRTLTRDFIRYSKKTNNLVTASLILRYFLLLIFGVGLLTWKLLSSDISWGILIIGFSFTLYSLDLKPLYNARKMFRQQSIYFLFQKSLYLFCIWFLLILFPKHFSVFSIGIIMLSTILLYLYLQHRSAMKNINSEDIQLNKLLTLTIWIFKKNITVFCATVTSTIVTRLNQLILKQKLGFTELGSYAAAWQIILIGSVFLDQVSRIGNPASARYTKSGVNKIDKIRFLFRYSTIMIFISILFSFPMIFFSHEIHKLFFKPEYFQIVALLPIFGIYIIIYSIGIVFSQFMINSKMENKYFLCVALGALVSLSTCSHLISKYGTFGAGIALLISHGASIGLYLITVLFTLGVFRLKQTRLLK